MVIKSGLSVLLHVKVGTLESASIQLVGEGSERKLVVKTDRWVSSRARRARVCDKQVTNLNMHV